MMTAILKKLFLLLLILSPAVAQAQSAFPFKMEEKELANGLRVIVVPTDFPNLISLQIPVQTGSRNEVEAGKTGFAHFFEHMMFRGTKATPPAVYQEHLKKMGARQNAYTSNDYTNYHTTFAKEDLDLMLRLEADRFMNLDYDVSAFKTEALAVLGEYNKNSAQPGNRLNEAVRQKAFQRHTYQHTTMGFLKDIEDMPNQFAYARTFFDRWYRPEYTTIIIAGDVRPAQAFALVEKYFGRWKRGSYKANIPAEGPPQKAVYVHVPWDSPTLTRLGVAFRGPAFSVQNKDYAALNLLYEIAFGENSDLYRQLVIKEQKLDGLSARPADSRDPDLYAVDARVKDPKDSLLVRDAILRTFMQFTTTPVSQESLTTIRSNLRNQILKRLDNTESIAGTLAHFVQYERKAGTLNQVFRLFDSITPEDIQKVAQRVFSDSNLIIATLAQGDLPAGIDDLPSLSSFAQASQDLAKDVPFILQRNSNPFLDIKLLFKVGSALDPKGQEGLAYASAQMITEGGSQKHSVDDIKKRLFPSAADFQVQVDKEMSTFHIRVHKDQAADVLDLLLPTLTQPGLRSEDFARVKADALNRLRIDLRTNNEEELGKERLQELLYAGTPYAHPSLGTVAGLESLKLEDVRAFISQAYRQGVLSIGVNGDISETALAKIRSHLGKLPATAALQLKTKISGKALDGIDVDIVQKNSRATALSLGHPLSITRSHPDFPALWLARAWLGEHRSSMARLFERIRDLRGLNYGDYAYIEAFPGGMYDFFPPVNIARRAQIFEIWIRPVVPANAPMALRIALFELDQLIKNGLTREQFEGTRSYLMKNVYLLTANQDQQLGYALDSAWYGMGEYTKTMRDALQRLTLDDVNGAIRKHLSSENLQVVAITEDAESLKDLLQKNVPSTLTYTGEKPQELLDEDKLIGSKQLRIRTVTITPVDQVFAK